MIQYLPLVLVLACNEPPPPCEMPPGHLNDGDWTSAVCATWGENFGFEDESAVFLMLNYQGDVEFIRWFTGAPDHVMINYSDIADMVRLSRNTGAKLIMFHNHTYFKPKLDFSDNDLEALNHLLSACAEEHVELYDFVLIAPDRLISARSMNLF